MTYIPPNPNGQETMANSAPVVIASNQSAIDVEVTDSVLPTGAATEAKQDTIISHVDGVETLLTAIDADTSDLSASVQEQGAVYTPGKTTIIAGVRQDAGGAPSGVADGDVHPFVFNEEGRLKVSAQPAIYTAVTGNITGNGQNVSADVSRASNVMFHCTGTFSTINCTFEGSIDGGTTWFAVQAVRSNANTIETTTGNLSATPAYAWEASVNALTNFRIRSTAYTSGTQTWRILPGAYATEPIPAAQVSATQPVSGTVTASNTAGNAAADAAVTGNPVRTSNRASSARPTAVSADNDVVEEWSDRHGARIIENAAPRGLKDMQKTTITSSTSETTIVTAVASIFMDLYGLIITNTSATACVVTIKDATTGTTRFTFAVPAGDTRGFMLPSSDAHKQAVVNNNWTATCSASVASIEITALTVRRV